MNAAARNERRQHIVYLYFARKRKRFNYMIVTLLGENLKNLKLLCPEEKMPASTWARIGIQCLYCIKLVHDVGKCIYKAKNQNDNYFCRLCTSRY